MPFGVSLVAGVLALGVFGCVRTAVAQNLPSASDVQVPLPESPPRTPATLDIPEQFPLAPAAVLHQAQALPPRIVAEAGVLPTSAFAFLDRLDEFLERNFFSFRIPGFRARIALAQATERIAELQELERQGQLTARRARNLLAAHKRLLAIAQRTVSRQLESGRASRGLVFLLTRTELAVADILEELEGEIAVEIELRKPEETPKAGPAVREEAGDFEPAEGENGQRVFDDFANLLEDMTEELADFEKDILQDEVGQGASTAVPADILRFLAEQKIAKVERDLFKAVAKIEERLAHGKIVVAEMELRSAAESSLLTARQLFAAGNYAEALSVAREAREIAHRLKSGKIAFDPEALLAPRGDEEIERVVNDLVLEGLLSTADEAAAVGRARVVLEQVRNSLAIPPRRDQSRRDRASTEEKKEEENKRAETEKEAETEDAEDKKGDESESGGFGSSGSGGGSGSSGSGSP